MAAGVAAAAGIAAYPYLVVGAVLLLVWLLRSGSLLASATGDRQRLRGAAKWYDVVVAPLSAPWHLVRSIPTTFLLCVLGRRLRGRGRRCSATRSRSPSSSTLFVSGLALVGALYLGPGRLAGAPAAGAPGRPAEPARPRPGGWRWRRVLLVALVLGLVSEAGVHWAPAPAPGGRGPDPETSGAASRACVAP